MLVQTENGPIEGFEQDDVVKFLGIPYAEPPVGDLRFEYPVPRKSWTDIFQADEPGPVPPQWRVTFPGVNIAPVVGIDHPKGEDFLRLNVWRPLAIKAPLPVMVWVHGGGWVLGSKDMSAVDGAGFARSGVICVNINYRLGVEGFLPIPGAPTNLGLRDIILALQWIAKNIAAFGGDAANVTLFGESAGGHSVANLVTSPLAHGLFKRCIVESGHAMMTRSIDGARPLVDKVAELLGVTPEVESFRCRSLEECAQAAEKANNPESGIDLRDRDGRDPTLHLARFVPVHGDDVLPLQPFEAFKNGAGADIDILIGSNAEEMRLLARPAGVTKSLSDDDAAVAMLGRSYPSAREILIAFGLGTPWLTAGDTYERALTDLAFRWPIRRLADEHRGRTHVYEFTWRSTALDGQLGACHGLEMPFVFNTLSAVSGPDGVAGLNPPQRLADRVHAIWVGFARDGSLPWSEYDRCHREVFDLSLNTPVLEAVSPASPFMP